MSTERLLTPAEVSALFRVHVHTIARWARDGKINCIRTPGGHRRYRESEIRDAMRTDAEKASGASAG